MLIFSTIKRVQKYQDYDVSETVALLMQPILLLRHSFRETIIQSNQKTLLLISWFLWFLFWHYFTDKNQ
jgi:hypothetical protein